MKDVLTQKLSGQMLYKLGHASETHEAVCYALGTRQRVRDFSNINSLKWELRHEGFKIIEADYMKMWKDWQEAGLGVILLGRGKKQTKFIHYYDMRKIAQAALDGKDIEVELRNRDQKSVIDEANRMQLDRITGSLGKKLQEVKIGTVGNQDKTTAKNVPIANKNVPIPAVPDFDEIMDKLPSATLDLAPTKQVFISLRPNFFLDLKLPQDVTAAELDLIRDTLARVAPVSKIA